MMSDTESPLSSDLQRWLNRRNQLDEEGRELLRDRERVVNDPMSGWQKPLIEKEIRILKERLGISQETPS
jgi:hypothetical protein